MTDSQRDPQKSRPAGNGDSADSCRPKAWVIAAVYLGLALTTLAIYWQVSQFEFVNWDDNAFVHQNPHVASGLSVENFQWSLGIHGPGQWHPVSWWVHQLNCQLALANQRCVLAKRAGRGTACPPSAFGGIGRLDSTSARTLEPAVLAVGDVGLLRIRAEKRDNAISIGRAAIRTRADG